MRDIDASEDQFDASKFTEILKTYLAAFSRHTLFGQVTIHYVVDPPGEELPYSTGVEIEKFQEERGMRRIHASVVVEKEGHKAIVIGSGGGKLKEIATAARLDMERLFGSKVYLEVWVKVRGGWTQDEAALRRMGYG